MQNFENECPYSKDNVRTCDPKVVVGSSDTRGCALLDSKLISPTLEIKNYNVKLVDCNDFIQVYFYKRNKIKKNIVKEFDLNLKKIDIDTNLNNNNNFNNNFKKIEERNIIRSKLSCQRLAKANIKDWETFITLTFAENVTDVNVANKEFRYFIDKIRRVKKDFKYLCITEFQKRGAVHYHLLTNISINDNTLMYTQVDNKKFRHIKYWHNGLDSVEVIKGDPKKVIGYISKYMTKDIDNRLFSKHRYFYSQNLVKPKNNFINLDNEKEVKFYNEKIQDKELIYQNNYINSFDNENVLFLEFKK